MRKIFLRKAGEREVGQKCTNAEQQCHTSISFQRSMDQLDAYRQPYCPRHLSCYWTLLHRVMSPQSSRHVWLL